MSADAYYSGSYDPYSEPARYYADPPPSMQDLVMNTAAQFGLTPNWAPDRNGFSGDESHGYSGSSGPNADQQTRSATTSVDLMGSPTSMAGFTRYMAQNYGPHLTALLHDPVGGWLDGQYVGPVGGHRLHVRVAWPTSVDDASPQTAQAIADPDQLPKYSAAQYASQYSPQQATAALDEGNRDGDNSAEAGSAQSVASTGEGQSSDVASPAPAPSVQPRAPRRIVSRPPAIKRTQPQPNAQQGGQQQPPESDPQITRFEDAKFDAIYSHDREFALQRFNEARQIAIDLQKQGYEVGGLGEDEWPYVKPKPIQIPSSSSVPRRAQKGATTPSDLDPPDLTITGAMWSDGTAMGPMTPRDPNQGPSYPSVPGSVAAAGGRVLDIGTRPFQYLSTLTAGIQRGIGEGVSNLIDVIRGKQPASALLYSKDYSILSVLDAAAERFWTGKVRPGYEQPVSKLYELAVERFGGDPDAALHRYITSILEGTTDPVSYLQLEQIAKKFVPAKVGAAAADAERAAAIAAEAQKGLSEVDAGQRSGGDAGSLSAATEGTTGSPEVSAQEADQLPVRRVVDPTPFHKKWDDLRQRLETMYRAGHVSEEAYNRTLEYERRVNEEGWRPESYDGALPDDWPCASKSSGCRTLADWLKDEPELLEEARVAYRTHPEWQGIDPDNTLVKYVEASKVERVRNMDKAAGGGHHPRGLALGGGPGQELTYTGDTGLKGSKTHPYHAYVNDLQGRIRRVVLKRIEEERARNEAVPK